MHTVKSKKQLKTRIKKISGQVQALEKQLDDGKECIDILYQISAIRGAVNSLMTNVIEGHLLEHVAHENSAEKRHEEVEVALKLIKSYLK